MFFLIILTIKRILTDKNYEEFLSETSRLPAFILMFSPYCGHCRAIHPTWSKLIDRYEAVANLIVGEIDCVHYSNACTTLLESHSWPTFALFWQGQGHFIHPSNRTMEGFIEKAEEIRRQQFPDFVCSVYPTDFKGNLPAIVYTETAQNNETACHLLHKIEWNVRHGFGHFFLAVGETRDFSAYLIGNKSIKYDGDFGFQSLVDFAFEWTLEPFGDWRWENGVPSKRRLAFFVHELRDTTETFQDVALPFIDQIIIRRFWVFEFRKTYPAISIKARSLIVFDKAKKKFKVFQAIKAPAEFSEILVKWIQGGYDENMKSDIAMLDRPHKILFGPNKSHRSFLRPHFIIPAIVGPVILGILLFVARSRFRKIE
jgi:thiol-disulfide isomerase/thioredoxin